MSANFLTHQHSPVANPPAAISSDRVSGAFVSRSSRRSYWIIMAILLLLSALATLGLLAYKNPMPFGSERFWIVAQRRTSAVTAMGIVAVSQAVATVAFQTVTNNRIITPSIMGFQSLYTAIHTATIYFFGASGLIASRNLEMFIIQLVLMILLSLALYSWLLTGKNANMHAMLLIGIIVGGGLGSVSTFMQRMLTPSEFDILTARLFGSVNNAEAEYYPIAIPLVVASTALIYLNSRNLNVLGLGREVSQNLGVNHRRHSLIVLVLVAVLMAVSTALVGPMTFLGFLVAVLAYQWADTFDHRYIMPMAALIAYMVLTVAYFLMQHVFYAQGVVSIVIELVGGIVFLMMILKKGRL